MRANRARPAQAASARAPSAGAARPRIMSAAFSAIISVVA
jgi:hypothetical protein